jgi:hypothetical protein
MTRTSPAAEPAAGGAADPSTLRALELPAIVEQLAAATAFEPSRELALASAPMADAAHVALLQDQTDEADRLLAEQAQASIGGARDIRAALDRARRGGRLTAEELLDIGETLVATERFAARRDRTWPGSARRSTPPRSLRGRSRAASTRAESCSTPRRRSWLPSGSGCGRRRTASGIG